MGIAVVGNVTIKQNKIGFIKQIKQFFDNKVKDIDIISYHFQKDYVIYCRNYITYNSCLCSSKKVFEITRKKYK